ncbi:hypothetical protein Clacol_006325 [Clathrus columnatus]|uniref:Transcription factor CBF/NF-Y/archaeal histone domain-containing protein n=1 Tax=Clathrus columnatus TaxID=1419009 RepID=A0AAV5AHC2_9AGAM|nr:hypothetical protein Clacol_006325 [Clathrus columnatus]
MSSDREGQMSSAPPVDDDLTLPKATKGLVKLQTRLELLPKDISCAKETRDLIIECCVEFIHLISSDANEICEQESKKTIAPEHIIGALKRLGFDGYVAEVDEDREKKTNKWELSGKTEEELLEEQQRLFAASRMRYEASAAQPP